MDREELQDLLSRVGDGSQDAREELLAYIAEQPEGIQVLALEALQKGGEETYEQLMLTLADDPSLVIRSRGATQAAPALATEPVAPEEADRLRSLLDTLHGGEDREARVRAARGLGQYRTEEAIQGLVQALQDEDRRVAAAAVEALWEIGRPAVPPLVDLLATSEKEQVQWHTARALSRTADERAIGALLPFLDESNSGLRWLAAESLVHIGRPVIEPLLHWLAEKENLSGWIRHGAWHVLNKLSYANEDEAAHYRALAKEIKNNPKETIPVIARRELARLNRG